VDRAAYLELFFSESREHLGDAYRLMARLELGVVDRELMRNLLRHMHSIKGMAATMGFEALVGLTHALEDLLEEMQDASVSECYRLAPQLSAALVRVGQLIDALQQDDPEALGLAERNAESWRLRIAPDPKSAGPLAPRRRPSFLPRAGEQPDSAPESISDWRIELHFTNAPPLTTDRIVNLLMGLGEFGRVRQVRPPLLRADTGRFEGRLVVILSSSRPRAELEHRLGQTAGVERFIIEKEPRAAPPRRLPSGEERWVRVRASLLDGVAEQALDLMLEQARAKAAAGDDRPTLTTHLERSEFLLKELYGTLRELRLVPFDTLAQLLDQTVRELATELGKQTQLRVEGGALRVDRSILEAIQDPLVQMVRNAVDHGLETEQERIAAGKPVRGTLLLSVERRAGRVRVSLADDGRGLSAEALKRTAVQRGLLSEQRAAELSDQEAFRLITLPSFSTAAEANRISGRGVGMDVVCQNVEQLGGHLQIRSNPGVGTRISLWVPMTLALIQALLVRCCGELFAVPISIVNRVIDLEELTVTGPDSAAGTIPELLELEHALGLERRDGPTGRPASVLLLALRHRRVGIVVDEIVGSRQVVVKPFQQPLKSLDHYSGAALLEDGTVALVLDPLQIVQSGTAHRGGALAEMPFQ